MSRLKSGPAAKPAKAKKDATRAKPAAGRGVFVQAPKSDIYVVLLGIALGAILLGCLLLILFMNTYGFATKPTGMATPDANRSLVASVLEKSDDFSTVRL